MPSYSSAFKEQAVPRLMPPSSQSIPMVSRDLNVSAASRDAFVSHGVHGCTPARSISSRTSSTW